MMRVITPLVLAGLLGCAPTKETAAWSLCVATVGHHTPQIEWESVGTWCARPEAREVFENHVEAITMAIKIEEVE